MVDRLPSMCEQLPNQMVLLLIFYDCFWMLWIVVCCYLLNLKKIITFKNDITVFVYVVGGSNYANGAVKQPEGQ